MIKRWLAVIGLGSVAIAAALYFLFYRVVPPEGDPFSAVPVDAGVIFTWNDPLNDMTELQSDSLWLRLQSYSLPNTFQTEWQQLAQTIPPPYWQSLQVSAVSVHKTSASAYGLLYLLTSEKRFKPDELLPAANMYKTRQYKGSTIYEYQAGETTLALSYLNGILVVSRQPFLVESAVAQASTGESAFTDPDFKAAREQAKRNSRPKMYLNLQKLGQLFSLFVEAEDLRQEAIANYASWVVLEYDLVTDGVFLNGYLMAGDKPKGHPALLLEAAAHADLTQVLPFNTALLYSMHSQSFDPLLRDQTAEPVAWYEEAVLNWLGSSVGLAVVEPFDTQFKDDCFLVASATDTALAKSQLLALAADQQQVGAVRPDRYKGFPLFQLEKIDGWERAFGFNSHWLQSPYVTIIDEYVVFGNSVANLKVLIERYLDQQTLDKDLDYRAFREKMADEPAINLYINTARSQQLLQAIGSSSLRSATNSANSSFFTLNPLGLQATHLKDNRYLITGMLQTGKVFQAGTNLLWKAELDTLMIGEPVLVENHNTGAHELLVQDAAHKLYLIDKGGSILWSTRLDGPIVGPVYQVDYYLNNKLQYLFTTSRSIQLIDRLGRDVENFPLRLPAEVTSGLAMFDYVRNGKFRMFVGCANGNLYGFYKSGKPLPGWSPKKGLGILPFPMQHNIVGSRDYLVVTSNEGRIEGFARNGNTRIQPRKLNTHFKQPFVLEKTGRRDFELLNVDTNGVLFVVDDGASLQKDTLTDVTGAVHYAYADMDGDGVDDHILMDDAYLKVIGDDGELLLMYTLPDGVENGFQLFTVNNETCIGLTSKETGYLYMVRYSGSLYEDFPLKGHTRFLVTDQLRPGEQVVATGMDDNTLTLYRLQ